MENPLVSILIPAYNAENHIEAALNSAKAQIYKNIEIVIVNDGSTDKTARIIDKWVNANCHNIKIKSLGKVNGGSASARNFGLSECEGEIISLLDADDIYHPERIERLLPILLSKEELGVVYTAYYQFSSDDNKEECLVGREPYSIERLMNECCVTTNALIKKKYLDFVGGWNENYKYIEDYKVAADLATICDMQYVDEPLFYYRKAGQNKTEESVTTTKQWHKEHIEVKVGLAKKFGVYRPLKIANAMVGGIGDLVAISGVYKFMKQVLPDCKIAHVAYDSPFFDVIEHNPNIDFKMSTNNLITGLDDLKRDFKDYKIITTDYFYRFGWDFWKTPLNLIEFFCLDILNCNIKKEDLKPEFYYDPSGKDFEKYEKFVDKYGKSYIIIEGQTRSNKEGKEWKHFDCIYERLDKLEIPIISMASPDTPEILGYKNIINIRDTTIRECARFIEMADYCVSVQSGQSWIMDSFEKNGLMLNIGAPHSYAGRSFGDVIIANQKKPFSPDSLTKKEVLDKLELAIERFSNA